MLVQYVLYACGGEESGNTKKIEVAVPLFWKQLPQLVDALSVCSVTWVLVEKPNMSLSLGLKLVMI